MGSSTGASTASSPAQLSVLPLRPSRCSVTAAWSSAAKLTVAISLHLQALALLLASVRVTRVRTPLQCTKIEQQSSRGVRHACVCVQESGPFDQAYSGSLASSTPSAAHKDFQLPGPPKGFAQQVRSHTCTHWLQCTCWQLRADTVCEQFIQALVPAGVGSARRCLCLKVSPACSAGIWVVSRHLHAWLAQCTCSWAAAQYCVQSTYRT